MKRMTDREYKQAFEMSTELLYAMQIVADYVHDLTTDMLRDEEDEYDRKLNDSSKIIIEFLDTVHMLIDDIEEKPEH